ncbi:hypothetical protein ES705_35279 [subsurface metagenome]|jgi:prepilin-type N-terminal cleavage/methylation domain-containing protein
MARILTQPPSPEPVVTRSIPSFCKRAGFIRHNPFKHINHLWERASARDYNGKFTRHNGFSLIELLVALVILSIVLLPFLSTISYRLSKERENDEMIKAIEIAKSKMEEVLLLPEIKDSEEIIENKFLIKIKILDGDKHDEPVNLKPIEARITVLRLKDKVKLIELSALK